MEISDRERYRINALQFIVEPGDQVKVFKQVEPYEGGWNNDWVPEMDAAVGKISIVTEEAKYDKYSDTGIPLYIGNKFGLTFRFPYFCLEIVR